MSAAASAVVPGRRVPAVVRALFLLVALLLAPPAAAPAEASAPPPALSSSCEPGEGTRETPEAALRLPTGHPVRLLLTAPPPGAPPRWSPVVPTAQPAPPSHRALRTVVLRC
ncbi:hypothetical protein ACYBSK_36610 [Streptomyces sp. BYX5S]